MWRDHQGAYLIDEFGVERPAMLWLRAYLKDEFVPNESLTLSTATGETSIETDDGTLQMIAEVLPQTSTLQTVHWTINNPDIATISENGLITAVSNGTVTVTAMSLELNSEVSDQMDITISGQVSAIQSLAGAENINIYPNPVEGGLFTISGIEDINSVIIIDLQGKQLTSIDTNNQKSIELNLDVPAGMYIVRLSDGTSIYHAKITIR
jgi:hypothetical protein